MREFDVNHRLRAEKLIQQPMDNVVSSTNWQKWSGNAKLPKRLKYLLVNSEVAERAGPSITIPFKPLHWTQITSAATEKDYQSDDNSSRASITSWKRSTVSTVKAPSNLFDDSNWARCSFYEFISSIPWLNCWATQAIDAFEKVILIEEYSDGQTITKAGDILPFSIVR
jgi:hypothetical protein